MAWSVFKDTMRYTWRMTLIWGIGFAFMMALVLQMAPALEGLGMVELVESLPQWMMGMTGIRDPQTLGTPEGLIVLGVFGKLALLFAAYPVILGLRVTAIEESEGMMDVMLSLPLPRWRVIFEKFLAFATNVLMLMAMTIAGLFIGQFGVSIELDVNKLVLVTATVIPVMIFLLALTTFTGAVFSRRQLVLTIVTVYIVFSFSIQTVGPMVDAPWMDAIESVALFTYYDVETTLVSGVTGWHVGVMLGLAVILLAASFFNFERRDIAV